MAVPAFKRSVEVSADSSDAVTADEARAYLADLRERLRDGKVASGEHRCAVEAILALIPPLPPYRPHSRGDTEVVTECTREALAWFQTLRPLFAVAYTRERKRWGRAR